MVSKNPKIQTVADVEAMSKAAAETIVEHLSELLQTRDVYSIALSGGSTPRRLYELLANDAKLQEQIPWDRVHFFWGDERHVPPSHPDSNYRMANTALLSKVPIPSKNIHRIRAEDSDADKAAADYEQEIRRFFKIDAGQLPRFNPGTSALEETKRLAVANWIEKFQSYRFTLTVSVINNADRIIFLASGEEKADTLKAVLEDDIKSNCYPAQRIQPSDGMLIWFLDQSAAGRLAHDR
jgi:6-phosphogluconolactonase